MASAPQPFFWYELMTSDLPASEAFYKAVAGWNTEAFPGAMDYIVAKAGEHGVGGLMALPEEARKSGTPPMWVGYIHTTDVDAAAAALKRAGGTVHRAPADIPGVGRLAVVADPQGAVFNLMTPQGGDRPPIPPMTPGDFGWRELYANEWSSAFDFYAGQFGWTKEHSVDMGPMGTYQLFKSGDDQTGGMMTRPPHVPHPFWQFYINVADIDAAAKRVTDNGGQVLMGPQEVPGGGWIVHALDPQGAAFALTGRRL